MEKIHWAHRRSAEHVFTVQLVWLLNFWQELLKLFQLWLGIKTNSLGKYNFQITGDTTEENDIKPKRIFLPLVLFISLDSLSQCM